MAAEKSSNKQKRTAGKSMADDILNGIKKDEILSSAQKVINSAVNVLEEEIAAGILAAKKIENKVLDVDNIRSDPDDLMNRIRRDTHEAVDLFLDALTAITKQVNNLSSPEKKEESSKAETTFTSASKKPAVVLLETLQPLKPGGSEIFMFSLLEDTASPTKINFQKTQLFGPNNNNIPSKALKVIPATFTLKPKEEKEISIKLTVPKNTPPGIYNGFVTDTDNAVLKVILNVEVIK